MRVLVLVAAVVLLGCGRTEDELVATGDASEATDASDATPSALTCDGDDESMRRCRDFVPRVTYGFSATCLGTPSRATDAGREPRPSGREGCTTPADAGVTCCP